jgi:4-hydroxy-tetrahydrodipicolinate synthase
VFPHPLSGIVPALVTPFRDDERIDFSAWQKIIDVMVQAGVNGLFAAGGQGEFFSLDDEERVVALRFCRQYAARRVPVYGNVGCVSTRESVRLAQKAENEGIDYAVAITPYYLKPTQEELFEHYSEICRAVHIPVLAYNIPERTGVNLMPATARRIAEANENFIGLKDSSGDLDQVREFVAIGAIKPFSVFIGRDHLIRPALELGCAGAVTACANVAPKLFVDLYLACQKTEHPEASRLQSMINPLREAFALGTFPSVVKEAMDLAGLPAGRCRKPAGPLSAEAREKLAAVVETLREANYLPQKATISAV